MTRDYREVFAEAIEQGVRDAGPMSESTRRRLFALADKRRTDRKPERRLNLAA